MSQLSLFADADGVDPAPVSADVCRLAAALPARIRLGTSSWSFPGWTGLVYAACNGKPATEQMLARHGLSAYARHPLFRTVSLDRTFYAPLTTEEFAHYAAQVPDDFRFVVKAPAAITDPVVRKAGSGEAARDNPSFLDTTAAASAFVRPAVAGLGAKAGPLVVRWNLHAGRSYDDAKAGYLPFNRIVDEDLPSRTSLARLARSAAAAGRDVFITINNKAEGSAPLSVEHLAQAIAASD